MELPNIAVSCGDLNGVGLECLLRAVNDEPPTGHIFLFIPNSLLHEYIHKICPDLKDAFPFTPQGFVPDSVAKHLTIVPTDMSVRGSIVPGVPTLWSGAISYSSLTAATDYVLQGRARSLLTLPISKQAMSLAGFQYTGHTEYLEAVTGRPVTMMLSDGTLRVALVTIHIPVRHICHHITSDSLELAFTNVHSSLRDFYNIAKPRIAILALNPHGGDGGLLGSEETDVIIPWINSKAVAGFDVAGPFSADGFFAFDEYKEWDAIIAMYHDQGLIPLKHIAHGAGVNITLGLPFLRLSPDHGPAFNIAGTKCANFDSVKAALYHIGKHATYDLK